MDFPIILAYTLPGGDENPATTQGKGANLEFVYGYEELKQDIYLLLKTLQGRFLQDISLGTMAVPHTIGEEYLYSAVRRCVEQIKGLQCKGVEIINDRIVLTVVYNGAVQNFDYSVLSL